MPSATCELKRPDSYVWQPKVHRTLWARPVAAETTQQAFANDNTLAQEYWSALAAWLVETGQIDGDPVAPSVYWTNGLAL